MSDTPPELATSSSDSSSVTVGTDSGRSDTWGFTMEIPHGTKKGYNHEIEKGVVTMTGAGAEIVDGYTTDGLIDYDSSSERSASPVRIPISSSTDEGVTVNDSREYYCDDVVWNESPGNLDEYILYEDGPTSACTRDQNHGVGPSIANTLDPCHGVGPSIANTQGSCHGVGPSIANTQGSCHGVGSSIAGFEGDREAWEVLLESYGYVINNEGGPSIAVQRNSNAVNEGDEEGSEDAEVANANTECDEMTNNDRSEHVQNESSGIRDSPYGRDLGGGPQVSRQIIPVNHEIRQDEETVRERERDDATEERNGLMKDDFDDKAQTDGPRM